MGLAPLLGFLLDALLGGTRLDRLVPDWVARVTPRAQFVSRNAAGSASRVAGWGVGLWVGGLAVVFAWLASLLGYVLYQEYGLFLMRSLVFLLLFGARGLTARGIEALVQISSGDMTAAKQSLAVLGARPRSDDPESLFGESVRALAGATLGATLIPLFWGVVGGSTLAAGALAVHLAAQFVAQSAGDETPMNTAIARLDQLISLPAAWVGGLVFPLVVSLVGGRRTAAAGAFFGAANLPPRERLANAICRGFELVTPEGSDGPIASGGDVQNVVQVLFVGGFVCALLLSGVSVLLHHVI